MPQDESDYINHLSPIDRWRFEMELRNRYAVPEQERQANLRQTREDIASIVPGLGQAISARDAYQSGGQALSAYRGGNYREALMQSLLTGLSSIGAVAGLPTSRIAGRVARGAQSTAYAIPAWHGSPSNFSQFENRVGGHTGDWEQGYGHYLSSGRDVAERYATMTPSKGRGSIYQVDINAEPEHFVKFGRPFNEQSPYVQEALTKAGLADKMGGIFGGMARSPEGAKALKDAGIVGLSYVQNSMPALPGRTMTKPATNYVVFDADKLNIRSKATFK